MISVMCVCVCWSPSASKPRWLTSVGPWGVPFHPNLVVNRQMVATVRLHSPDLSTDPDGQPRPLTVKITDAKASYKRRSVTVLLTPTPLRLWLRAQVPQLAPWERVQTRPLHLGMRVQGRPLPARGQSPKMLRTASPGRCQRQLPCG